jgi:hypothetical protein
MTEITVSRPAPISTIGKQLYQLLPAVYRDRDNTALQELGDFGKYLDACGELLDLIRGTLDQRLADSFPDNPPPEEKRASQPWLLPYFAQLVDVQLIAPDPAGQRDEVARAVAWRQRKGTVACIEEIAEAVGRIEVEVQEGWRRVATTPRIGMPLIPAASLGVDPFQPTPDGRELKFDPRRAIDAARHPGIAAATVDLRRNSGAILADASNPASHVTFDGESWWRQVNPHGVPCAPGSYQDVSRRTVDVRTPDWARGWVHPRRILLFAPPPLGFFGDVHTVRATEDVILSEGALEGTMAKGHTITVTAPGVVIDGCAIETLNVTATGGDAEHPVLRLRNCLIQTIDAGAAGLVEIEYCTVLGKATFVRVNASECIFAGELEVSDVNSSCVRFSRLPKGTPQPLTRPFGVGTNTGDPPVFQDFLFCEDDGMNRLVRRPATFGEPGAGVLHAATPPSVRLGAEDGGEMGAYHVQAYALRMQALIAKLEAFVPVGMSAVLITDPTLLETPAAQPDDEGESEVDQ